MGRDGIPVGHPGMAALPMRLHPRSLDRTLRACLWVHTGTGGSPCHEHHSNGQGCPAHGCAALLSSPSSSLLPPLFPPFPRPRPRRALDAVRHADGAEVSPELQATQQRHGCRDHQVHQQRVRQALKALLRESELVAVCAAQGGRGARGLSAFDTEACTCACRCSMCQTERPCRGSACGAGGRGFGVPARVRGPTGAPGRHPRPDPALQVMAL